MVVNELIPGIPETLTNEPSKLFFFFRGRHTRGGFSRVSAQSSVLLQHDVMIGQTGRVVMVSAAPVKQCRNKHLKQGVSS